MTIFQNLEGVLGTPSFKLNGQKHHLQIVMTKKSVEEIQNIGLNVDKHIETILNDEVLNLYIKHTNPKHIDINSLPYYGCLYSSTETFLDLECNTKVNSNIPRKIKRLNLPKNYVLYSELEDSKIPCIITKKVSKNDENVIYRYEVEFFDEWVGSNIELLLL